MMKFIYIVRRDENGEIIFNKWIDGFKQTENGGVRFECSLLKDMLKQRKKTIYLQKLTFLTLMKIQRIHK